MQQEEKGKTFFPLYSFFNAKLFSRGDFILKWSTKRLNVWCLPAYFALCDSTPTLVICVKYDMGKNLYKIPQELAISWTGAQCWFLPKILSFLAKFSQQNWRVIFEVFQSNFIFAELNSTVRCLLWENEQNTWEISTSSLRSHNSKSGHFGGNFLTLCDATAILIEW